MRLQAWMAASAAATLSLAALADGDVAWCWDTSQHPAEDSFERTVVLETLDVSPLWRMVASAASAVDAGAYCERITAGCDLTSRPVGTVLMFR